MLVHTTSDHLCSLFLFSYLAATCATHYSRPNVKGKKCKTALHFCQGPADMWLALYMATAYANAKGHLMGRTQSHVSRHLLFGLVQIWSRKIRQIVGTNAGPRPSHASTRPPSARLADVRQTVWRRPKKHQPFLKPGTGVLEPTRTARLGLICLRIGRDRTSSCGIKRCRSSV